jgi:predicted double-glycine peptidase
VAMNGENDKILVLPVKPVVQVNKYECGVACVQTILGTRGIKSNRLVLKRYMGTNKKYGTLGGDIKDLLEFRGLSVHEKFGANLADIEAELTLGRLCLVAYQAYGSKKYYKKLQSGHYSVVFGIEGDYLWLADPFVKGKRVRYKRGIRKIRKEVFESRWVDADGLDHWYLAV